MAGFTLTSFVEIDLPPDKEVAKASLHFFITLSICINFLTVAMVTFVTVWGGGKALRGQDGIAALPPRSTTLSLRPV